MSVGGHDEVTGLPHLDERGRARMVDVGGKPITERQATARSLLRLSPATAALLAEGRLPKGDALPVARLAGIMAAKRTADLIPLCHSVALSAVDVRVEVAVETGTVEILTQARTAGRTGVEMEALVAAATAALSLYDMVKAVERGAVIERVELLAKTGGQRGDWTRGSGGEGGGAADAGGRGSGGEGGGAADAGGRGSGGEGGGA